MERLPVDDGADHGRGDCDDADGFVAGYADENSTDIFFGGGSDNDDDSNDNIVDDNVDAEDDDGVTVPDAAAAAAAAPTTVTDDVGEKKGRSLRPVRRAAPACNDDDTRRAHRPKDAAAIDGDGAKRADKDNFRSGDKASGRRTSARQQKKKNTVPSTGSPDAHSDAPTSPTTRPESDAPGIADDSSRSAATMDAVPPVGARGGRGRENGRKGSPSSCSASPRGHAKDDGFPSQRGSARNAGASVAVGADIPQSAAAGRRTRARTTASDATAAPSTTRGEEAAAPPAEIAMATALTAPRTAAAAGQNGADASGNAADGLTAPNAGRRSTRARRSSRAGAATGGVVTGGDISTSSPAPPASEATNSLQEVAAAASTLLTITSDPGYGDASFAIKPGARRSRRKNVGEDGRLSSTASTASPRTGDQGLGVSTRPPRDESGAREPEDNSTAEGNLSASNDDSASAPPTNNKRKRNAGRRGVGGDGGDVISTSRDSAAAAAMPDAGVSAVESALGGSRVSRSVEAKRTITNKSAAGFSEAKTRVGNSAKEGKGRKRGRRNVGNRSGNSSEEHMEDSSTIEESVSAGKRKRKTVDVGRSASTVNHDDAAATAAATGAGVSAASAGSTIRVGKKTKSKRGRESLDGDQSTSAPDISSATESGRSRSGGNHAKGAKGKGTGKKRGVSNPEAVVGGTGSSSSGSGVGRKGRRDRQDSGKGQSGKRKRKGQGEGEEDGNDGGDNDGDMTAIKGVVRLAFSGLQPGDRQVRHGRCLY